MTRPAADPARRAAWAAYLLITVDVLPALDRAPVDTQQLAVTLAGLVIRIRTWASAWGATGTVLAAAVTTGQRLHRDGHHGDLARLLRVIALRLFRISSRRPNPARGAATER
ncbi:hypothetical protein [Phytohabitans suffuscus]|uniref:Uncharacterized protein n=1 Tax=Phytohabitans suffuscus TaxID=624315 RepID=A0A6F8YFQ9_9ACTN|nr:hypothetical protein [Phytohabitans suffuscus]BCB84781.1 hypothetical protein Psuf_020940 [Phytohabitans suffuscus]